MQLLAVSAFFRKGKTTAFKLFEKRDLTNCAEVFQKIDSSPQDIVTNMSVVKSLSFETLHLLLQASSTCIEYIIKFKYG